MKRGMLYLALIALTALRAPTHAQEPGSIREDVEGRDNWFWALRSYPFAERPYAWLDLRSSPALFSKREAQRFNGVAHRDQAADLIVGHYVHCVSWHGSKAIEGCLQRAALVRIVQHRQHQENASLLRRLIVNDDPVIIVVRLCAVADHYAAPCP